MGTDTICETRTAVIGDVGGHLDALAGCLEELGADCATGTLPAGLRVISVGDLVHKGPDSSAVLQLVDRFRRSGASWTQLAGNHEHQYLNGELFWSPFLDLHDAATLWDWWGDGWMTLAATAGDTHLVTHAGLTAGLWDHLGQPGDARAAAAAINDAALDPDVTRPGFMLGGNRIDLAAGVNWAEATREVVASWEPRPQAPFDQVCGHTNPYIWTRSAFADRTLPDRVETDVDRAHRRCRVTVAGADVWFIDPGFGRHGGTLHALTVEH